MVTNVYKLSGDNCVEAEWRSGDCVEAKWRRLSGGNCVEAEWRRLSGGNCVEAKWKRLRGGDCDKGSVAENVYDLGETTGVEGTVMCSKKRQ